MPEVPPNAAQAAFSSALQNPGKPPYFQRLSVEFRSLMASLKVAAGVAAVGPADGCAARVGLGQLEVSAGVLSGRRPPGGEPELVGDILDPLSRSLAAALSPQLLVGATPTPGTLGASPAAAPSIAELAAVEEAVRRVAWGGDRRAGVARIELGGAHLGTAIIVRGEGRSVALSIELGNGEGSRSLPERLVERLKARGLAVTDIDVR